MKSFLLGFRSRGKRSLLRNGALFGGLVLTFLAAGVMWACPGTGPFGAALAVSLLLAGPLILCMAEARLEGRELGEVPGLVRAVRAIKWLVITWIIYGVMRELLKRLA